jgi:hypothetical protein
MEACGSRPKSPIVAHIRRSLHLLRAVLAATVLATTLLVSPVYKYR